VAKLFAAHWLEAVQAPQVWVVALQIGEASEQVPLVRQPTHLFAVGSQTPVAPEHWSLVVHWTHAPLVEQMGLRESIAPHWLEAVHAVQMLVPALQIGVTPEHVALVRHPTHVPAAEQSVREGSLSAWHWSDVAHGAQVPALQIGALAGQVALVWHPTHLLVAVSQTGVAPEH
jgi:3-deoxy-D-manno-octulosonic-acid transferase